METPRMLSVSSGLLISLSATLFLTATASASDCDALTDNFKSAIAEKSIAKVKDAMAAIADDSACNFDIDAYRLQEIDFAIGYAGAAPTEGERKQMVEFAQNAIRIGGTWRSAETMGDYYARRNDFMNALAWYETGISFLSRASTSSTPQDREQLLARAEAAKHQASDDSEGRHSATFATTTRDADGSLGGIYSRDLLRGAQAVAVPLPINFFYDETRFTPVGEKAMEELLEAVKQQNIGTMTLVGHTDPRGNHNYNVELSKRRAAAVRDYLLSHGVSARIDVDGKGPDSPFDVSLLGRPVAKEEEWALDRRVEWVRQGSSD
jgi:outer membrane protein OmpA-like peptidoglycan-associated protein